VARSNRERAVRPDAGAPPAARHRGADQQVGLIPPSGRRMAPGRATSVAMATSATATALFLECPRSRTTGCAAAEAGRCRRSERNRYAQCRRVRWRRGSGFLITIQGSACASAWDARQPPANRRWPNGPCGRKRGRKAGLSVRPRAAKRDASNKFFITRCAPRRRSRPSLGSYVPPLPVSAGCQLGDLKDKIELGRPLEAHRVAGRIRPGRRCAPPVVPSAVSASRSSPSKAAQQLVDAPCRTARRGSIRAHRVHHRRVIAGAELLGVVGNDPRRRRGQITSRSGADRRPSRSRRCETSRRW
jgi:hypothetical protein